MAIEPTQQIADKALMDRVTRGDQVAFSDLYDRLSQPLFSMILQMLGDRAEAEDALQEVTLQIWRRAASYDAAQSSVFSWAVMLTRSRVIDRLRARGRRSRVIAEVEPNDDLGAAIASETQDAAESAAMNDEAARARAALLRLPSDQRQAIEMAFFNDMTYLQIAEQSGRAARHGESAHSPRSAQNARQLAMISDELQDQASLYALGILSAEETAAFEHELATNLELQALMRDLREASATVALTASPAVPSPALKDHVMRRIASEAERVVPMTSPPGRSAFSTWIPWAIAAGLVGFCGFLLKERAKLNQQLASRPEQAAVVLVSLKPSQDGPADAQAVIAWDPIRQTGTLKISNLPAQRGKDYQLWAVDAAQADPINAGVVRVDQSGVAHFKPTTPARQVKAFAISIEREGGVPKREGPIILIGNA